MQVTTPQDLSQGFHLQRWEWSPTALNFYVDGTLVHSVTDPNLIPSEAANIFFNVWPVNKTDWSMPGSKATRYTMVDKFCFTPPATGGGDPPEPPEPVQAVIDASATAPTIFAGGEASFSAAGSTGEDLKYTWDFGDGTSASGDPEASGDVNHEYALPGYYTAKLTVTDLATNTMSTTSLPLAVLPNIHAMPSARAVAKDQTVTFDVQYPVQGLTYEWKFSDGTTAVGAKISHAFDTRGFQDVTLTIYDDRTPPSPERIIVDQRQTRVNSIVTHPFAAMDGYQTGPSTVYLDGSTYSQGRGSLTYEWDFGDGSMKLQHLGGGSVWDGSLLLERDRRAVPQ